MPKAPGIEEELKKMPGTAFTNNNWAPYNGQIEKMQGLS